MSESEQLRRPRAAERRWAAEQPVAAADRRVRSLERPTPVREVPRTPAPQIESATGVVGGLRRHRSAIVACMGAGFAVGLGWGWLTPTVYTAETRLGVGSQALSAQAVPGYVLAMQTMTSNYARYVETANGVKKELKASLGPGASSIDSVTASPIPESNVLRIEIGATDPQVAVKAANLVSQSMVKEVSGSARSGSGDLQELNDITARAAAAAQAQKDAQAALDAAIHDPKGSAARTGAARQALIDATTRANVLSVQQQAVSTAYTNASSDTGQPATLTVIRRASATTNDGLTSLERDGAVGLIAGGALALGLVMLRDRKRGQADKSATPATPARDVTRRLAPTSDWTAESLLAEAPLRTGVGG